MTAHRPPDSDENSTFLGPVPTANMSGVQKLLEAARAGAKAKMSGVQKQMEILKWFIYYFLNVYFVIKSPLVWNINKC
jgi:hypothetical protein